MKSKAEEAERMSNIILGLLRKAICFFPDRPCAGPPHSAFIGRGKGPSDTEIATSAPPLRLNDGWVIDSSEKKEFPLEHGADRTRTAGAVLN